MKLKDNTLNLCDYCTNSVPECLTPDIEFGIGIGEDNVIACANFDQYLGGDEPEFETSLNTV